MRSPFRTIVGFLVLLPTAPALAQLDVPWFTIDSGGGTSTGGVFSLSGTIGQPDAGSMGGGAFALKGGFWATTAPSARCVADVDDGSGTGIPDGGVTIDDLLYYITLYADGVTRADVDDGSGTGTPDGGVTIDDLLYFLLRFEAGC